MPKKTIKFLPIFILTVLALCGFFPVVFAQTQISLSSPIGDAKSPAEMVGNLYKFSLLIAGASAFAVMIYGAILYTASAGNSSKQQDAREWIMGAIWGVILLLSAYLILYTINPNLVNLVNPALEKIDVNALQYQAGGLSEQNARSQLAQAQIGTKGVCSTGQTNGCVSFERVQQSTIDEIIRFANEFKNATGEQIFISGGTEGGHTEGNYSHETGYKFDLSFNEKIGTHLTANKENYTTIDLGDGYLRFKSSSGSIYTFEPELKNEDGEITRYAHWDVSVIPK
jgi:hypothetical protein